VIDKLKQEGDRVRTGDRIYTVADLNHLWMKMDAYESDLAWLRYGQEVEFTTEAYPGEVFKGRVAFIDPMLNEATRTVKVRVNVSNEDGRLKPEMFVRAIVRSRIAAGGRVLDASLAGKWSSPMHPEIVKDEPGNCDVCGMPLVRAETLGYVTAEPSDIAKPLVIPVTAALLTGTRAIVYIQVPNAEEPTYEGREIVLGPRAGDYYLVKAGLEEGQLVVTNGSFKLDSALQISAKPSMMTPEGGGGGGGHHHGGESKPSKGGEPMQMAGDPGMSLSPQLKVQLQGIIESVEKICDAIESAELGRIRGVFGQLGQQVAAVDGEQLSGDMQAQLQEFAMLLRNDSVEGKEITDLQNADRIYLVTKRHAERLQELFGLSQAGHSMEEQSLEVPPEFRYTWRLGKPCRLMTATRRFGQSQGCIKSSMPSTHSHLRKRHPIAGMSSGIASQRSPHDSPRPTTSPLCVPRLLCCLTNCWPYSGRLVFRTETNYLSCIARWRLRGAERVGFNPTTRFAIRTTVPRC
jgi:Cu(I)/Ag(I) efflux system membrane fusion protein